MIDKQASPRRDVPGWAQVFGSVFTVVLATVTAATLAGATVAVLTALAATALCVTILVGLNQQPWSSSKRIRTGVSAGVAIVLIGAAVWVGVTGRQNITKTPTPPMEQGSDEPALITSSPNYRLKPSASIFTNDQDKVDLDTGCPGHGPTKPQVGPERCGENADLILEETELFTWERQPRLTLLPRGEQASYTACRKSLTPSTMTGNIELKNLQPNSELCVKTDKGSIAAVRVENLTNAPTIEISFDVWVPEG